MEPVNRAPAELETKENVFLGVIGALLFSLAGALVYFILNRVGYIASLSALVGAYCACFGYGLFTRKKGTKAGIISAAAATVIVMVLAVVFCLAFDLYEYVGDKYANVKLMDALRDTVRSLFDSDYSIEYGFYVFTIDKSVFVRDLIATLVFTALGIAGFIGGQRNKKKAAQQAAQAQVTPIQTTPPPVQPMSQPVQPASEPTETPKTEE